VDQALFRFEEAMKELTDSKRAKYIKDSTVRQQNFGRIAKNWDAPFNCRPAATGIRMRLNAQNMVWSIAGINL
jgi:hypothetical protein